MRKSIVYITIILSFFLMSQHMVFAQVMGFDFPEKKTKQVIPFKKYNNLIVIPVKINDAITVNFMLDTSIEHTIITEKGVGDQANVAYVRQITLGGTKDNPVRASIANNVRLELPGGVVSEFGQQALVMERDYFNLRSTTGADIYGIIGYDVFKRFVVEIDNTTSNVILHEPKEFNTPKGYETIPLKIIGTKPFVQTKITFESWDVSNLDLMVDIGANHAVLFNGDSSSFLVPTRNLKVKIAKSFEGDINGYVGRIRRFNLGKFEFEDPIASFSTSEDMYLIKEEYNDKKGAIGQDILSRFDLVLDFHNKELHLKKNAKYKNKFEYDLSGLSIAKDDLKKDTYFVSNVISSSPAANAGILEGDIIESVNGEKIDSSNFSNILLTLRSKPGRSITVHLIRGEKPIKAVFKLYKMI